MKKIIFRSLKFIFIFFLAFGLFSCNKNDEPNPDDNPNPQPEDKFNPTSIETVLSTYTNNQDLQVEGVVYGVLTNGFYMADSKLGRIFVLNSNSTAKLGDKVQVTGQFSITGGTPQVKNVKKLEKVSEKQTSPVELETLSVKEIKALDQSAKTGVYGKYVKVEGILTLTDFGYFTLTDDSGETLLFAEASNKEYLIKDQRVEVKVIVHSYSSSESQMQVAFGGSADDITAKEIPFADLALAAKEDIESKLVTSVYGRANVPSRHPIYSLTYTWAAETNDYLTIENNKVTVKNPATDQNVKLTCTVANDKGDTQDFEFTVVVHAIVEKSVSEFLADLPVITASDAIVNGVVIAITRNQSGSLRTYVLQDKTTSDIITLDFYENKLDNLLGFACDEVKAIKIGDEITATASYRSKASNDRPTLIDCTKVEIKSSDNPVNQHIETAIEIHNADEANALAANWADYTGKLIKFTNPYLNFSTSTDPSDTSFVRIGFDDKGDNKYGPVDRSVWLSLLIVGNNLTLGGPYWYKNLNIPYSGFGAAQNNITIYAYCLYVSSTIIQFVIPDVTCYECDPALKAKMAIQTDVPTTVTGGTTMDLFTATDLTGPITWTSSDNDIINPTTGEVKDVLENAIVTLTATFMLDGVETQVSLEISVVKNTPLTVTEVLDLADGTAVKFSGVVVGFASDGNAKEFRKGIIVMDNATGKMIMVDGLGVLYGKEYPNYVDSANKAIKVGDEVLVKGAFSVSSPYITSDAHPQKSRKRVDVQNDGEVTILSSGNALTFNKEAALVVSDNDSMAALVADIDTIKYATLIKVVGTNEHPVYLGGSSASSPFNIKVFMNNATDNNGTKYNTRTFSLKSDSNEAIAGENWVVEYLGIPGAFTGPSATNPAKAYVGEFYMVIGYLTGTYYQCLLVNMEDFTLKPLDVEAYKAAALANVPAELKAGSMTALPTSSYLTGDIEWSSSDSSVVNLDTLTVAEVAEDTKVTISASFKVNGETVVATKEVTVAGKVATVLTVDQVLASENGASVLFSGVIAAFHSHGNETGTEANGVLVMDNTSNKMVFVDGLTGTYPAYTDKDSKALEIGQEVTVKGLLTVSGTRYSVAASELTAGDKVELKFNDANAIVVNNNDEFTALFTPSIKFGTLIKLVGTADNPIRIGGSSSDAAKVNFKVYYADASTNDESKVAGKGIVLKGVVNEANVGSEWYKKYFPGVTGAFIAPNFSKNQYPHVYTGTMYMVVCHETTSYMQCSVVNPSAWSLTEVTD